MRVYLYVLACLVALMPLSANASKKQKKARKAKTELWPDGTKMDTWFLQAQKVNTDTLGKQYVITDYGVKNDSTLLQTSAIQGVIDLASKNGGGVVVIPEGTFLSGALFFRPKTHLLLSEGGKLKASDRIVNFPILTTRIEGETCKYFSAFINADHCDGFTIAGKGTIDGKNKPYKNLNGEIWVKQGADKRRITENSEILALFQDSGSYQADAAGVAETNFNDLDRYALNDYLKKVYALDLDILADKAEQLLKNIHVLNHNGIPTLAGYLFFGKHPEYNCPTFMVKAVSFFGNELAGTQYRDTKEIIGNMPQIYEKSMSFLKSNLHNIQEKGASFNTLGKLEIAEEVLEEVLQNALVHRDLLRSAPIRIFIFDNRVEIISPGALAGGLTEEDIRSGKTYQRNPYMATFATNALHYRGIGSGIVRILSEYPEIEIVNDVSGKEFKVIVWRKEYRTSTQKTNDSTQISTQKVEDSTQTSIPKECLMDSDTTQKSKITTQKDLDTTWK